MITGRGHKGDGTDALLLGLSRANVEKLMEGKPIRVSRATHGAAVPEGWEILILFGETEQAIYEDMRDAGLLSGVALKRLPPGAE